MTHWVESHFKSSSSNLSKRSKNLQVKYKPKLTFTVVMERFYRYWTFSATVYALQFLLLLPSYAPTFTISSGLGNGQMGCKLIAGHYQILRLIKSYFQGGAQFSACRFLRVWVPLCSFSNLIILFNSAMNSTFMGGQIHQAAVHVLASRKRKIFDQVTFGDWNS